jgi:tetratricopeptide (TPR) repeat protein
MKITRNLNLWLITFTLSACVIIFESCATFTYKTYKEQKGVDDPEPDYNLTLNPGFQEFTSFMFIGNRIENFGTYFNTYFNAIQNYDDAYEDYVSRVLSGYSERFDSIYAAPNLSQESKDNFNKAIEKASKVIQYHKSSAFMDRAVLLIGKAYFYLGDYLKAERKFGEFISKLSASPLLDEALLFHGRTLLRLGKFDEGLAALNNLTANSKDEQVIAGAYQSIAEYYINKQNYDASLENYRKSIKYSKDNSFKAQMQFLIAAVTARQNAAEGVKEFRKVLDYSTTYELEYLTRFNIVKYQILSREFSGVLKSLDKMIIDYKDEPSYLSEINYLVAKYYDQRKDYKKAVKSYKDVIFNYPKTVASSDASFALGDYYEHDKGDYLTAYRYYRYSSEESSNGHFASITSQKLRIFKKYFDLRSVIAGEEINTAYDSLFLKDLKPELQQQEGNPKNQEGNQKGKGDEGGKPGVLGSRYMVLPDSSDDISMSSDSLRLEAEKIAKAKFELAELFMYDINNLDSAENYLDEAYDESGNYDFKSRVLYALADLYRESSRSDKYEETLRTIVDDYPSSQITNECRKLLNLPVVTEVEQSTDDSIFTYAENSFADEKYPEALDAFKEIANNFPNSEHSARVNYAIGWIYENVLSEPDSAVVYYTKVAEISPNSEYYTVVTQKLAEYENFLNPPPVDTSNTIDTNKTNMQENNNQQQQLDKSGDDNSGENNSGDVTGENENTPKEKIENPKSKDPHDKGK